jgi:hypothetical protein
MVRAAFATSPIFQGSIVMLWSRRKVTLSSAFADGAERVVDPVVRLLFVGEDAALGLLVGGREGPAGLANPS